MQTTDATDFEVLAEGYEFLEAPRLSPHGDVWFADLTGSGVFRKRPGKAAESMLSDRQWVGGMVFDRSGAVLCGGRGGIVALDPRTGATRNILTRLEGQPVVAVNDMEADGRGGFYAGTIDFVSIFETGEEPAPGSLFHLAADGAVTVLRRDVFASNGLALSPCGKWLYHSETSRGVWRYPLGDDGLPGEGELLVELEDSDGLAADSEGGIWVACWSSGLLKRFAADGACTISLRFPYPHIVSVAFGAADPGAIYIATGGNAEAPGRGAILRMPLEVHGIPAGESRLALLE